MSGEQTPDARIEAAAKAHFALQEAGASWAMLTRADQETLLMRMRRAFAAADRAAPPAPPDARPYRICDEMGAHPQHQYSYKGLAWCPGAAAAPPAIPPRPTLDEAIEALRAVLIDAEHAERWVGVHERAEAILRRYDDEREAK